LYYILVPWTYHAGKLLPALVNRCNRVFPTEEEEKKEKID